MISKALRKNDEILRKELRKDIGGEIKGLMNISKTKMVDDARKVNNRFDNQLTKLKDSINSIEILLRNRIESLEFKTSVLQTRQEDIDKEFLEQVDIHRKVKIS